MSNIRPQQFDLLETIRWSPADGFFLLDRHLTRMQRSAAYFEYAFDASAVRDALERAIEGRREPQRLRLMVSREGVVRVEGAPLDSTSAKPARVGIAAAPIDPSNVFLFHKTTHRVMYANAAQPDCDDVVLWTAAGDITETTLGNIVVEMHGRKVTPPIEAGLLAGTFREELLARGEIVEGRVTLDDLKTASRIWIINSVREWWPASLYIRNAAATTPSTTSAAMPTAAKRSQR